MFIEEHARVSAELPTSPALGSPHASVENCETVYASMKYFNTHLAQLLSSGRTRKWCRLGLGFVSQLCLFVLYNSKLHRPRGHQRETTQGHVTIYT